VVTLVVVAGGGRAVLAVSANTLLQRVVPAQLVGRVFGIVEGLSGAGLAAGSLLTASLGLLLGTLMDPRKMQMLFAVILLPATMLGCVYYPWSALHVIRWLQILVLINPMVYMTEGLRAALTPSIGHMPLWAIMLALVGGTAVFGYLGIRSFRNRVVG